MDELTHLRIAESAVSGVVVITLAGELDLASGPALEDAIAGATSSGAKLVIVDLRGVEFMDSSGVGVLVKAHQAAPQSGYRFAVVDELVTLLDALRTCSKRSFCPRT